jgi:ABC-type transport system involved in multi-copper enzyme maturation permease subunit
MGGLLTIAWLTLFEARRRRIVLAACVCGAGWLAVFGTGLYFIERSWDLQGVAPVRRAAQTGFFTVMGLYAVNFLTVAAAVLLPVDTLSGEIGSGVIETLASKPIRRADIVLGKWVAYWVLTALYLVTMAGGLVTIVFVMTGYLQSNLPRALALVALEYTVLLTVCLAGGTFLSTVTNGIVAFGFYGLAFAGGLVEQVGSFTGNRASRDIGTAISLVAPTDALWRLAAYYLQPAVARDLQLGPPLIGSAVLPSSAMIWWAVAFIVVVLLGAVGIFERRAL